MEEEPWTGSLQSSREGRDPDLRSFSGVNQGKRVSDRKKRNTQRPGRERVARSKLEHTQMEREKREREKSPSGGSEEKQGPDVPSSTGTQWALSRGELPSPEPRTEPQAPGAR